MLITAANPPWILSAIQLNITAVQVSWSAPASGATVTGYVIYYETTGGSEQSVTVGAAATEYTLTGLMIGQMYNVSIVALSAQLPSIATNSVEVTVGQTIGLYMQLGITNVLYTVALPNSPTNLTYSSQSPTFITLSWEQPAGDAVDRYDIVYIYQGGCSNYTQSENMATVNDGTAREYTLQNLQGFSDYSINITAVNDAGQSMQTTLTVTTQSAGRYR